MPPVPNNFPDRVVRSEVKYRRHSNAGRRPSVYISMYFQRNAKAPPHSGESDACGYQTSVDAIMEPRAAVDGGSSSPSVPPSSVAEVGQRVDHGEDSSSPSGLTGVGANTRFGSAGHPSP